MILWYNVNETMKNINIIKTLFLAVFLSFFVVQLGSAQSGSFTVDFDPRILGPNMEVNASLTSYSFDVNRSYITWLVNGVIRSRGLGTKNFNFTTGDVGEETELSVKVLASNGSEITKTYNFSSAEIDMLWKAQTYTPHAYKGKALPSFGSAITVVAVPNFGSGTRYDSSELIYNWSLDYGQYPDRSGVGRDSFVFNSDTVSDFNLVQVEVSSFDGKFRATGSVRIESTKPEIIFYEDHALEGVFYGEAIKNELTAGGSQISVRAEPYFFSKEDLGVLSYVWTVNRKEIEPEARPDSVEFRIQEGITGSASVVLNIRNIRKSLQLARGGFHLNLGFSE